MEKLHLFVIPVKTGIPQHQVLRDPRLRGDRFRAPCIWTFFNGLQQRIFFETSKAGTGASGYH